MKLPPKHRITEEDLTLAYEIMQRDDAGEDELAIMELVHMADDMHRQTGVWPRVSEVIEHAQCERYEQQQQRLDSWHAAYAMTEKDFTTLATDDSGPMFDFVQVAKKLKASTGQYPSVKEVRDAQKKS